VCNKSCETSKTKVLVTTLPNRNEVHDEIRIINSGNACYVVQNCYHPTFFPNAKDQHHVPVVLCGCETWSLYLRKEHKLYMFVNKLHIRIFGPKKYEVSWQFRIISDIHKSPSIVRIMKSRTYRMHTEFWWGNLLENFYLED
jgi:hypothetical protein